MSKMLLMTIAATIGVAATVASATNAIAPAAAVAGTTAQAVTSAAARPALLSRQATRSVMLGAVRTGARIVAVGERGIILLSDDEGKQWRQASVPVSVTLTAVRFADASNGVAVGHAGIVLTTADGGATWTKALDGGRIGALSLEAAQRSGDALAVREAERLVAEGADKPLLDICLLDKSRMLAIGAYGLAMASEDGGRTWISWMDRIPNPKGLHLNTVRTNAHTILIAGERGYAALSQDGGRSFRTLSVPYQGSFFTAEMPAASDFILAGLRGNTWRSTDAGASWRQLANPVPVSITASSSGAGTYSFANQAGMVLTLRDNTLIPAPAKPLPPLNGLLDLGNGQLLALSIQGIIAIAPTGAAQ